MKHINLCSYCGKHNPSTGVKKDSPGSKRDTPGSKKDASNVPYKCHHCDKYFPQKQNLKRHIQTHFNTTTESFSCEPGYNGLTDDWNYDVNDEDVLSSLKSKVSKVLCYGIVRVIML